MMIRGKLSNNGKTIGFSIDNSIDNIPGNDNAAVMLTVQGQTYALKQFHLHFGCDGPGSEHSVDGQEFGGEVIVFRAIFCGLRNWIILQKCVCLFSKCMNFSRLEFYIQKCKILFLTIFLLYLFLDSFCFSKFTIS